MRFLYFFGRKYVFLTLFICCFSYAEAPFLSVFGGRHAGFDTVRKNVSDQQRFNEIISKIFNSGTNKGGVSNILTPHLRVLNDKSLGGLLQYTRETYIDLAQNPKEHKEKLGALLEAISQLEREDDRRNVKVDEDKGSNQFGLLGALSAVGDLKSLPTSHTGKKSRTNPDRSADDSNRFQSVTATRRHSQRKGASKKSVEPKPGSKLEGNSTRGNLSGTRKDSDRRAPSQVSKKSRNNTRQSTSSADDSVARLVSRRVPKVSRSSSKGSLIDVSSVEAVGIIASKSAAVVVKTPAPAVAQKPAPAVVQATPELLDKTKIPPPPPPPPVGKGNVAKKRGNRDVKLTKKGTINSASLKDALSKLKANKKEKNEAVDDLKNKPEKVIPAVDDLAQAIKKMTDGKLHQIENDFEHVEQYVEPINQQANKPTENFLQKALRDMKLRHAPLAGEDEYEEIVIKQKPLIFQGIDLGNHADDFLKKAILNRGVALAGDDENDWEDDVIPNEGDDWEDILPPVVEEQQQREPEKIEDEWVRIGPPVAKKPVRPLPAVDEEEIRQAVDEGEIRQELLEVVGQDQGMENLFRRLDGEQQQERPIPPLQVEVDEDAVLPPAQPNQGGVVIEDRGNGVKAYIFPIPAKK